MCAVSVNHQLNNYAAPSSSSTAASHYYDDFDTPPPSTPTFKLFPVGQSPLQSGRSADSPPPAPERPPPTRQRRRQPSSEQPYNRSGSGRLGAPLPLDKVRSQESLNTKSKRFENDDDDKDDNDDDDDDIVDADDDATWRSGAAVRGRRRCAINITANPSYQVKG